LLPVGGLGTAFFDGSADIMPKLLHLTCVDDPTQAFWQVDAFINQQPSDGYPCNKSDYKFHVIPLKKQLSERCNYFALYFMSISILDNIQKAYRRDFLSRFSGVLRG
jgi:hypothetical protein